MAKSLTTTGDTCRYGVLFVSLSLSSGFLCFLLLSSPTMAELLLPLTPIAVGGASHRRHNHWWPQNYALMSLC
ncbi:hypothetical protein CMV_019821 [Castanea mollissima]|uniref:Uncharacterized protein n=1 Tax=Castanea mollissima TaxID=60419 RepID=A0A8J4QZM6_9ROSI|nr:hypothetical protein CMV_019821 [Castanea mollissima]